MSIKNPVKFKVLKKNSWGHRFILEPKERIKFRERCKHNVVRTLCEKGYQCPTTDGVLVGCTPNVSCPRMRAWDKRHGLEKPYTMVENRFPDLKPTTFTWHPATESPGKKRVLMAFRVKGHEEDHFLVSVIRFLSPGVTPATVAFKTDDGIKKLPVAWAYYDEITKGIADWMVTYAEYEAMAWWPDKEETSKE